MQTSCVAGFLAGLCFLYAFELKMESDGDSGVTIWFRVPRYAAAPATPTEERRIVREMKPIVFED